MRIRKSLFIMLFSMLVGGLSAQVKHVVLISIDGLHPDMYLDSSWHADNLRKLMLKGTYADHMLSVFPAYTYPSHTAMLTGALPARSGVYFNQPKGSQGEWNWFMKEIRVPTLWQVLNKAGLTTAAVEWPVSVGPGITWDVPEIWDVDHDDDRITEARKYATPGLVEDIEQSATGPLDASNMNDNSPILDLTAAKIAAYILEKHKPNFLALHFATVDGTEHEYGRDGYVVRLALKANDRAVGIVMDAIEKAGIKDSTVVIIVGDHGFSDIHEVFRPNMLIKNIPARFVAAGGSAFLYRSDNAKGSDVNITKAVADSLNKLSKEKRKLFRIIDRKELNEMGADSSAILALAAQPGMVFSGAEQTSKMRSQGPGTSIQNSELEGLFIPTKGGHHGYDPSIPDMWTGFIAAGPRIKEGGHIKVLRVTDIAPLIAQLLDIDFETPDGELPEDVIRLVH